MSENFDSYYKWLGIPPEEQPPDYYRLLGVRPLEADADVIAHAADRQMAHVRTFQSGPNAEVSQRLLNEISTARLCLLTPDSKETYDAVLRAGDAPGAAASPSTSAPPPLFPPAVAADQLPPVAPASRAAADGVDLAFDARAESASRRGWGWRSIVAALCIGLASVALAWKIRQDRSEAARDGATNEGVSGSGQNAEGSPSRRTTRPSPAGTNAPKATGGGAAAPAELPDLAGAVDLLADVDVATLGVQGAWHREGAVLVSPGLSPGGKEPSYALLKLPASVPEEFTLAMLVERAQGSDALAIGFPSGGSRGVIVLDGTVGGRFKESPVSGIDRIDGREYYTNETKRQGRVFTQRRPYAVVCEVRSSGVRVTVDGKQLIDWQGEATRLSVGRQWQAKDSTGIVLGSYRSSYRFLKVVVAPL